MADPLSLSLSASPAALRNQALSLRLTPEPRTTSVERCLALNLEDIGPIGHRLRGRQYSTALGQSDVTAPVELVCLVPQADIRDHMLFGFKPAFTRQSLSCRSALPRMASHWRCQ